MNNLNIDNNNINNENYEFIEFNEKDIIDLLNKDKNYKIIGLTYIKNDKKSFNNFKEPLEIEQSFNTNITIYNIIPLENNSEEIKIIFSDNNLGKNLEGIIPKKIEKKYFNNIKLLTKKYCYNDLICEQIADYFNIEIKSETSSLIKFKKNVIYLQDNQPINKLKIIIADNALPFSLNLSSLPDKKILQAFSHFSYQITLGEFIILNLEYNKEKQKIDSYDIFSLKNNGYKHILKFFSNHFCNNYCKYFFSFHKIFTLFKFSSP
jgi:hypothetical protein